MLLGEHEHSLDDKNRLTLPARLRAHLGEQVIVTRGIDGSLDVYPRDEWERASQRIRGLDTLSAGGRTMQRLFASNATPVEVDRQGRIVIPAALLERLGIGRDVTVAGVFDHLEIWDRAAWREQQRDMEGSAEDVAERLANGN
jgi:MraZ protein